MKKMKFLILFFVLFVSCLNANSKISYSMSFDINKFYFETNSINDMDYKTIGYGDYIYYGNPGEPMLPCKILTFAIPYNAVNISITTTANSNDIYDFGILQPILKEQKTLWEDDCDEEMEERFKDDLFAEPDSLIYNSRGFFPDDYAKIIFDGFIFGDIRVVKIVVCPVLYNPTNNMIKIAQDLALTINYEIDNNETTNFVYEPIARHNSEIREEETQKAKDYVVNPENLYLSQIPAESSYGGDTIRNRSSLDFPTYNYTIITNRQLEPSFKKIVALMENDMYRGKLALSDNT